MEKIGRLFLADWLFARLAAVAPAAAAAAAESSDAAWGQRAWAAHVIVPQSRAFAAPNVRAVEITGVEARVEILEQAAKKDFQFGSEK